MTAYSWKEVYVIMSVICSKFLLKLVMRTWIFLKLSHVSTLSILDRGNPNQLLDCHHLFGACRSSLANAEIYELLYSFSLFYFEFEGNFRSTSPQGLIFGGAIYRRVFCVTSLGGLYWERL